MGDLIGGIVPQASDSEPRCKSYSSIQPKAVGLLNQSQGEMRIRRIAGEPGRTDFNVRTGELYLAALTCPHHLGAVASGSGVSVGVIMDVGTVSEQATRISRASRAVDSSFAMSVDSPFWSVSGSHRFGALSMLQKAVDLTRTVLESTKDFGLRRGSNGDWAIVVSLMLGRTSESLDAVKLLLCRHLVASRTRPASAAHHPTLP